MTELAFRLATIACAVAYMTTRSVFEAKLKRGSKRDQMKQASGRDKRELWVVAVTSLPMYFYMGTSWLDFAAMGLPAWARILGGVAALASVGLLAWTHAALGGNWSPFVQNPPSGSLVTGGPYRFVRHPMYTSFLVYNAGLWLLSSNWFAGPVGLLGFLYLYLDRVDHEEGLMVELFGDAYRDFAKGRGRVVPGLGRGRLAGRPLS